MPVRFLAPLLLALLAPAAVAQGAEVLAENYRYVPERLEVAPGATVTVRSTGEGHTVTAVDGSFDTGLLQNGETGTFTAPLVPGEHRFYCALHATGREAPGEAMVGVLVVRGDAPTPAPGAARETAAPGAGALLALLAAAAGVTGRRRR